MTNERSIPWKPLFTALGFFVAGILIFTTAGWVDIHPTEVGVSVNKVAGRVEEIPLGVGYHFFNRWITDVVIYKVASRAYPQDSMKSESHANEWSMNLKTNDGQNVSLDLTVIYALASNEVPKLHQQIGQNYEDEVLLPQVRSEARLAIGSYSAEDIYQGTVRDQIQKMMREKLSNAMAKYPAIRISDSLIRDFRFSKEFEQAIEQKKLAAQAVEINKNKALAQEEESKRQEAQARGSKLQAIQEAEGRAQSAKIEADANRYKLEQEAAGQLAKYTAEAKGKELLALALGGGQNVVALKFAETIPDKLQIWGIPTGEHNTSFMDLSGIFGKVFSNKKSE